MTYLVLARHGETVWHAENRYAGSTDVSLSPRGLDQAEQLARWANAAGLSSTWTSPLTRAHRTATVSAQASGVSLRVDPRLRELDFGDGEGLTSTEMLDRFPGARRAFEADPVQHHLPAGEDPVLAAGRFIECLNDIVAEYPDGRVLVVAHSTAIRLALCHLLGVPLRVYRQLFPALGNCTRNEIRIRNDQVAVITINSAAEAGSG